MYRMKKEKNNLNDSVIVEKALNEAAKYAKKLAVQTKTKFITRKVKSKKSVFAGK